MKYLLFLLLPVALQAPKKTNADAFTEANWIFVNDHPGFEGPGGMRANNDNPAIKDAMRKGTLPGADTIQYAVLYVYLEARNTTANRMLIVNNSVVYVDSSAVCWMSGNSNNPKFEIKLYKEGETEVSLYDKSTKINVEFGKEYYVECKFSLTPFHPVTITVNSVPPEEGKVAYQKISPFDDVPKLLEPLSFCQKIQDAWNKLLQEHDDLKSKFDSLPNATPYYFNISFTIDTSGNLLIANPDKFSSNTPGIDLPCFTVLQALLLQTKWTPTYVTKRKGSDKIPEETEGSARFMITSKGFESVEMTGGVRHGKWIPFEDMFYECNLGK
jgi:hypothetical protein